jgi:general secretion pathway protein C
MVKQDARQYSAQLNWYQIPNKTKMLTTDSLLHRLSGVQRLELSRRLIPWLNLLLVLSLSYVLAGISWRLWPQTESGAALFATSLPATSAAKEGTGLDALAALHLFGTALAPEAKPAESVIDAPETALSLTLRGIVAVSAGSGGRALIAEGSGDERLYMVGDFLSGGAMLHEVLIDRVILKRAGRFETLTLPRDQITQTPPAGASGSVTKGRSSGSGTRVGGNNSSVVGQLRTLRDNVVANPQQAFDMVQAQPVMEGGSIKGYRVSPGKERAMFSGTGLRSGDVVTRVNGIPVGDTAQLATLYEKFKTAERFDLVVERGGQETSLTINLKD